MPENVRSRGHQGPSIDCVQTHVQQCSSGAIHYVDLSPIPNSDSVLPDAESRICVLAAVTSVRSPQDLEEPPWCH